MTLDRYYVNANVMTYYRLKTDLSVMPHVKGVYSGMKVIYHTMVYSTMLRDIYSASCSSTSTFKYCSCPSQTNLVG
jgi:hypothetical protein